MHCSAIFLSFPIFFVLLSSVFWKDKTYHLVLMSSKGFMKKKNTWPLKWWSLSSMDPRWMFTGHTHSVMHCSISMLWLHQCALFLRDTRSSPQSGCADMVLPAARYVDTTSGKESEFNKLFTCTVRLQPPPYRNILAILFRCISWLNLQ